MGKDLGAPKQKEPLEHGSATEHHLLLNHSFVLTLEYLYQFEQDQQWDGAQDKSWHWDEYMRVVEGHLVREVGVFAVEDHAQVWSDYVRPIQQFFKVISLKISAV